MSGLDILLATCSVVCGFLFVWVFGFYVEFPTVLLGFPVGGFVGFLIYALVVFVMIKVQKPKKVEEIKIDSE